MTTNYPELLKPASTPISPERFRRAFIRFQAIHQKEGGRPLNSFADPDSLAFDWEDYKRAIPGRAAAILNANRWTKSEVGSGEILKRIISAVELPGNNLLQWQPRQGPTSRAHAPLYDAKKKPTVRRELEPLLFDLFKNKKADQDTFEHIVSICGKRYELLAYLFFVAAPDRFLPLRTRTFDKALAELGIDLKTEGQCGWENYVSFIAAMNGVRDHLRAEGILDASLLDAHSFCWIIVRYEDLANDGNNPLETIMRPFQGSLLEPDHSREFTPNDDAEVQDMALAAFKRQASGQLAEEIALKAERKRLRQEGRKDLAAQVELVSDRPGLGFDIRSYDSDGTDRFIEVKNVSNGNRFFLSEGERQTSRHKQNYWFYLVSGDDSKQSQLEFLRASELSEELLQPVNYLVRFKR